MLLKLLLTNRLANDFNSDPFCSTPIETHAKSCPVPTLQIRAKARKGDKGERGGGREGELLPVFVGEALVAPAPGQLSGGRVVH